MSDRPALPRKGAIKSLIMEHQGERCLVCAFPLRLGCHLHHIIAWDDGGPHHPLNLVALCPNHHVALERIRRHIAPIHARNDFAWLQRAQAALAVMDALPRDTRSLMAQLSEPHPLHDAIRQFLSGTIPTELHAALATDIARMDVDLLASGNERRLTIVIAWHSSAGDDGSERSGSGVAN